jgi:hypothetical protein
MNSSCQQIFLFRVFWLLDHSRDAYVAVAVTDGNRLDPESVFSGFVCLADPSLAEGRSSLQAFFDLGHCGNPGPLYCASGEGN